jgi:hypothetical protein
VAEAREIVLTCDLCGEGYRGVDRPAGWIVYSVEAKNLIQRTSRHRMLDVCAKCEGSTPDTSNIGMLRRLISRPLCSTPWLSYPRSRAAG